MPKPLAAIFVALLLFLLVEAALQLRSHLRFGQSVFNQTKGDSPYLFDKVVGVTLLRPSHIFGGSEQVIASNSVGLRSPEITEIKPGSMIRIVVLGASTVMGAYAVKNDLTIPALLQQELEAKLGRSRVEVINAGIVGLGISQQQRLFERLLVRFSPDLTIVYSGFNDFADYCREEVESRQWQPKPLARVKLPMWLLSVELLSKNTVSIRSRPQGLRSLVDAEKLDLAPYRSRVRDLISALKASGTHVLIARNARSYRPEQTMAEQLELSTTARFYNPCFDVGGLHRLYYRHNGAIEEEAKQLGVEVLPLDQVIPGGRKYFVDASHFSELGERLVARWLANRVEPWLKERENVAK